MKSIRLLPLIGLFLVCVLVGFRAGRRLAPSTNDVSTSNRQKANTNSQYYPLPKASQEEETENPISKSQFPRDYSQSSSKKTIHFSNPTGNGQLNLLVIGVDQTNSAHATLESLWLVVFSPDMPHLMFLPIYPNRQNSKVDGSSNQLFTENFTLGSGGAPGESFLTKLKERGIWWDTIILTDEIGSQYLVNFFGNMKTLRLEAANPFLHPLGDTHGTTYRNQDPVYSIETMPSSREDPSAAQRAQYELIQEICLRSASASPVEIAHSIFQIIQSNPNHIYTDLNLDQIVALWSDHQGSPMGFSCEFPSLAATPQQ